jgi:potassium efflux system protein
MPGGRNRNLYLYFRRLAVYAIRSCGFGLDRLQISSSKRCALSQPWCKYCREIRLQAIDNNFASGIILLFERPIKVGDIIQVNNIPCQVKKIGLRATIVESRDDAEIVIPNSDLITTQVTNWTLSVRRMRLKLPVGVAYGSDIAQVMELLMACAQENKTVLKYPKTQVLFLNFEESSLDFELRVRINDFSDRRLVQSELNQAIDRKFRSAQIEIPFPQRDLHLYPSHEIR